MKPGYRDTLRLVWVVGVAAFLTACGEDPPEVVEPIRSIKSYTISDVASGQLRKYSGIVQATDSSALSFQISGTVLEVRVNLGDRVKAGQVLAVLDKEPYELNVQAAEADLGKAKAVLEEKRVDFLRQKTLYEKDWVSRAAYDQALAAFQSTENQVSYAQSKLNLAKRDLRYTVLEAPFNGTIAEKLIDPHVEVRVGQKLFEVNADGAIEVAFDIPETSISRVHLGMPVTVNYPTKQGLVGEANITELGTVAGAANAFPVKAGLIDPPQEIRAGMTAEVGVLMKEDSKTTGYLAPIGAIAPGEEQGAGYVFVFDADSSTVRKTPVKGRGGTDNWVELIEGVAPGDIIAVAGVNFLVDGQKVKLMTQKR